MQILLSQTAAGGWFWTLIKDGMPVANDGAYDTAADALTDAQWQADQKD